MIDDDEPPLKRDFVVQRLSGIDVQQEGVFTIDIAVMRVFSKHPLVNAIMWDYLCAGSQTEDIVSESFDGPHGIASDGMLRQRYVTPDDAPRVFWKLGLRLVGPKSRAGRSIFYTTSGKYMWITTPTRGRYSAWRVA